MSKDPRAEARELLKTAASRLTPGAAGAALRERGKFAGAAWLLGASWAQIGALFSVRRETAMSQANKYLPPNKRATVERVMLPFEHVETIYADWNSLCKNHPTLALKMSVDELAQYLASTLAKEIGQ